jgi:anti-sigma factor RsiW
VRHMLRHPIRFMGDHRFTMSHASEYLDGELDERGRRRIETHTAICAPCRRLVESLRRTVAALRGLQSDSDAAVADAVIERLRNEA